MKSTFFWPIINDFDWYLWIILPLIIFFARIADVTLGTLRIILVSRGKKNIAPILGFFEVLIWITAIGQLVQNIHNITSYFGYAAGFAVGNFVGIYIEGKLAIGKVIVRVILNKNGLVLADKLHQAGFGATCFEGKGAVGPVISVFTIIDRKDLAEENGDILVPHVEDGLVVCPAESDRRLALKPALDLRVIKIERKPCVDRIGRRREPPEVLPDLPRR